MTGCRRDHSSRIGRRPCVASSCPRHCLSVWYSCSRLVRSPAIRSNQRASPAARATTLARAECSAARARPPTLLPPRARAAGDLRSCPDATYHSLRPMNASRASTARPGSACWAGARPRAVAVRAAPRTAATAGVAWSRAALTASVTRTRRRLIAVAVAPTTVSWGKAARAVTIARAACARHPDAPRASNAAVSRRRVATAF